MVTIMVFSAHPDDDVIGCGGSIAKHIKQGNTVILVYLSSGEAGSSTITADLLGDMREKEAKKAAALLGVSDLIFLRNADGNLEYNKQLLCSIIRLIREKRPHIVYMPHAKEGPLDHRITHKVVSEAIDKAAGPWFQDIGKPWQVPSLLAYEVWTPLNPSYTEDITQYIDIKTKAIQQHGSQIRDIDYDRCAKGLNAFRGIMLGKGKYAECFEVVKLGSLPS